MKRLVFLLMYIVIHLFLGCSDDEKKGGTLDPVVDVTSEGGYGLVSLSWKIPEDGDFAYTKILYVDPLSKRDTMKLVGRFNANASGFCTVDILGYGNQDKNEYQLISSGYYKQDSKPISVFGTSLGSESNYVAKYITVESTYGGVFVRWKNENNFAVDIKVVSEDGESVFDGQKSSMAYFYSPNQKKLEIQVVNALGIASDLLTFDYAPMEIIGAQQISKLNWKIDSSTGATGEGPVERLIDGDVRADWHNDKFPNTWAIVDMGQPHLITRFMGWRRNRPADQDNWRTESPKEVKLEISMDKETWHLFGICPMDNTSNEGQELTGIPGYGRYFRFSVTQPGTHPTIVGVGEVSAFGK